MSTFNQVASYPENIDEQTPEKSLLLRSGVAVNTLLILSSANAAYAASAWGTMPQGMGSAPQTVRAAALATVQSTLQTRQTLPNFAQRSTLNSFASNTASNAVSTTALSTANLAASRGSMTAVAGLASRLPMMTTNVGGNANPFVFTGKGLNLDLSSAVANVVLGAALFRGAASASVNVGGSTMTFTPGQKVTPAQYVALKEVLSGQGQTLLLNSSGVADGGSFSLNANTGRTSLLVVPTNVTAIDNFNSSRALNLGGDIINYGTISGTTTNPHVVSGLISGNDIVNEKGGLINTVVNSAASGAAPLSLTLQAANNLTNAGTIATTGTLNLVAGSGNLTNSGLISSTSGNINLSASANGNNTANLNVYGQGGTFSALNGNVNVNAANASGAGNVMLQGGDYLSKNLNVNAGTGAITGSVGQVTGTLNSSAEATHIVADTENLVLGTNCALGDPTYANSGNIVISGAVTASEAVTILAGGNITASGNAYVSTTPFLLGAGSDITLVAGAKVTTTGTSSASAPGTSITTGTATADFSAANGATGGNIDLSGSTHNGAILDASGNLLGGNAGNILLAANAVNGNGGTVTVGAGGTSGRSINASAPLGNGGNVTILAGANPSSTAATVNIGGSIQSSGGGSFQSGAINIATVNPTASTGTSVTYDPNGALHAGSATIVAGTAFASNGKVVTADLISAAGGGLPTGAGGKGGNITIQAGGGVATGNLLSYGGGGGGASLGINLGIGGVGGAGGAVTIEGNGAGTSTASIAVGGDVNSSGGGGGGSLGNAAVAGGAAGNISMSASGPVSVAGNLYAGDGGAGGTTSATSAGAGGGGSFGGGGGGTGAAGLLGLGGAGGGGGAGALGGGGGGVALLGNLLGGGGGGGGGIFGAGTAGVGSLVDGVVGLLGGGGSGGASGLGAIGGLGAALLGTGGLGGLTTNSGGLLGLGVPGLTLNSVSTQNADISLTGNGISYGGTLYGRNVALSAPVGSNASININKNLYGTTSVTLTAHGTGDITSSGGTVYTPNLVLNADSGNIGSATAAVATNAANLTANASGPSSNVYVSDSGPVAVVGANSAGANGVYSLTAAGNITAGKNESLTAGTANLNSTGALTSIGAAATPFYVTAPNLSANATGNVYVVDDAAGTVTLGASSAGALAGTFSLNASKAGELAVEGPVSAHTVSLTAGAGSMYVDAGVTGTNAGTVILTASGDVDGGKNGGMVTGTNVTVTSTNGGIGENGVLDTTAKNLTLNAANDVNVLNTGSVNLLASSAGSGDTFTVSTTPDALGNGAITVSGNIASTNGAPIGTINLNSSESGTGVGGIQEGLPKGTLTADAVNLADWAGGVVGQNGNGDLGSAASPLQTNTSALSAVTDGAVWLVNANTGNLDLGAMHGSSVNLTTGGGTTTTQDITTPGAFNLNTDAFTNAYDLTAGSVHITGLPGQDLTITNSGSVTATTGGIVIDSALGKNVLIGNGGDPNPTGSWNTSGANDIVINANGDPTSTNGIIFTGNQNFNTDPLGELVLNAAQPNQFIEVKDGVSVVANNNILANTANFILDGTGSMVGNILTLVGGTLGTTISNATGDVDLKGNVVYHGLNLVIMAQGNVVAEKSLTIDLSNSTAGINSGNGGNLTILAGYNFAPAAGQSGPSAPLVVSGKSASGGSVNLGNVNIQTGSSVLNANGGNVLVVANAGNANNGSIALGNITTAATNAASTLSNGGSVTLIGQGVSVGNILTTGVTGGNTTIASGVSTLTGPVQVLRGTMSGGSFGADMSNLSGNLVLGAVNTGNAAVSVATGATSAITGTATGSPITADAVTLIAGNGGIGSAAAPIYTTASTLTAHAGLTGSVYIMDSSGDITLTGSNWGSTFHLTNTDGGTITVASAIPSDNNIALISRGGTIVLPTSTITAVADPVTGNGGKITLIADTINWAGSATSPLVLNASAGTGTQDNGGTITVSTNTTATQTIGNAAGNFQFIDDSTGNGGTVRFTNSGGNVLVDAANGLKLSVGANGNGASISLTGQKVSNLLGGTLTLSANGNGTGNGGTLNISELGAYDALIGSTSNANFNLSATGANGGSISFATGGNLTVDMSGLNYNPTALNGNGGNIALTGATLTGTGSNATGPFILNASANILGTGNGGSASITLTKAGTAASVGLGSGQYELIALGGKKVGNGGSVSFVNAGDLTVDPKALKNAPTATNANGGSITLGAGVGGSSGNLIVSKSLSAAGKGKGNGGNITLTANGGTFTVGGARALTASAVLGSLSVKGKQNGNVSLTNLNGNLTVASALTAVNNTTLLTGGTGNILLSSAVGSATSNLVTATSAGSITSKTSSVGLTAKNIVLTAGNVAGATLGTVKTALSANTQNLTANAGGLVNLVDKSMADIQLNASSGNTFSLAATGNLIVNGLVNGGNSLTLSSGKEIVEAAVSDVLSAATMKLTAGRNGTGTSNQALQVNTSALTVTSGSLTNINNLGTTQLTLNGAKSSKSLSLASAGDILLNGVASAAAGTLKLTAGNANNLASILQGGVTKAYAQAKSVDLEATNAVGTAVSAVKVNTANLLAHAGGMLNAANLSAATSTVSGTAGSSFKYLSAAGANLGNITANAGNVTINAARGAIATAANSQILANNGQLLLQAAGAAGSIVLGGNSQLTTSGLQGGNVSLVVGVSPLNGAATRPAGLTESVTAGNSINYGDKGITLVKGAQVAVNAHGANVVFSSGKNASAIKINNGVVITADPPVASAPVVTADGVTSLLGAPASTIATTASAASPSSVIAANVTAPVGNTMNGSGLAGNSHLQFTPASAVPVMPTYNAASVVDSVVKHASDNHAALNHELAWVSETELASGEIPALFAGEEQMGITSNVSLISDLQETDNFSHAYEDVTPGVVLQKDDTMLVGGVTKNRVVHQKHVALNRGSLIFAPEVDTQIHTPYGVIFARANSLVLVLATQHSMGVYDFDDRQKNAVKINVGGKELALRPGVGAVITHHSVSGLEHVNPAQLFGYRHIETHELTAEHKGYTCEFSLPQAIHTVQPLKKLIASKHPRAQQMANHLLKTTSIMLQLTADGAEYKQVLRPRTVACLPD